MRRAPGLLAGLCGVAAFLACAPAVDTEKLLSDLANTDIETRQEATVTLDHLVETGQYQVFLRGLKSADPLHRAQSIVYLARFSKPEARAALRDLLRLDRRMMLPFNPVKMRPATEPSDSRILVAELVQRTGGDPEAIGVLLQGVDEGQDVASLVGTCFAVGALRDPKGLPFLDKAARHPEMEVARAAVQAAGQFKEPEAVPILSRASTNPATEVRSDALTNLAARQDAEARQIIKTMGRTDPSPDLRTMAFQTLTTQKDPDLVPYFMERLKDAPPESLPAVYEALARLTGQGIGPRPEAWSQWWARSQRAVRAAH